MAALTGHQQATDMCLFLFLSISSSLSVFGCHVAVAGQKWPVRHLWSCYYGMSGSTLDGPFSNPSLRNQHGCIKDDLYLVSRCIIGLNCALLQQMGVVRCGCKGGGSNRQVTRDDFSWGCTYFVLTHTYFLSPHFTQSIKCITVI